MGIITGILLVVLVIVAVLLVLIILVQDDGTEGAGILFGSAASQQYGAKKGNIVTKTTGILATSFIVIALSLSFLYQYNKNESIEIDIPTEEGVLEWWSVDTTTEEEIPLEDTINSVGNAIGAGSTESNTTEVQLDAAPLDTPTPEETEPIPAE